MHITIRKIKKYDFERYQQMMSDTRVIKPAGIRKLQSDAEWQLSFASMQNFNENRVIADENDQLIGMIFIFETAPKVVELGYMVIPSLWGQGVATKALGMVLQTLQSETEFIEAQAITMPDNVASQKVLLNNGFVQQTKSTINISGYDNLPYNGIQYQRTLKPNLAN